MGAYVVPSSMIFAQSVIERGDKLFPVTLSYLQRLYLEVYGPAVFLGWAPACREFPIVKDGEVLSGGNIIVNSFSKFGAYEGRSDNLIPSIARMNKTSPSLTNFYLDTLEWYQLRIPWSMPPRQAAL